MMRLVFACLLLVGFAAAQVPHSFDAYQPVFAFSKSTPQNVLPSMDIEANLEKARETQRNDGVWDFAQVSHCIMNDSLVQTLATGTLRTMSFQLDNAVSFAFYFENFHIPDGGALYIVSDRDTAGPFTHENRWENGDFQTRHVHGNHVEIHYFQETRVTGQAHLRLGVVTTAFRQPFDGNANAGSCNVHAMCVDPSNKCNSCKPEDRGCSVQCTYENQDATKKQWAGLEWMPQIRGTVAVGRAYNSRYCSGSFINNKDGRQLVLTAAHCGPAAADVIIMNFENPSCASTDDLAGPTNYVAGNLKTLVRNTDVDNELIEIGEAIPADWNIFLNGYDSTDEKNPASSVVGIHHPAGSNKKISYFDSPVVAGKWVSSTKENHWKINGWTVATTEGGSSGSPLFNHATRRIIGQLHGGSAACPAKNGWDVYGAVWAGYTDGGMKEFLGEASMDGEELAVARLRRSVA